MSRPRTYEETLFGEVRKILERFTTSHDRQLLVLEALASLCGGFDFKKYCAFFGRACKDAGAIIEVAKRIKVLLAKMDMPCSVAISVLAREPLSVSEQKESGAFYTDFRLARLVGLQVKDRLTAESDLVDLSAGSGILLSAVCEQFSETFPNLVSDWVSSHVYAYDLSEVAIRGTIAALSCYLSKLDEISVLSGHCLVQDSLLAEKKSFDIVVGNPPWGRIKLSRYAFSKKTNDNQGYGDDYKGFDRKEFENSRELVAKYAKIIRAKYDLIGDAEPDMYMAFLQEGLKCLRKNGVLSILIPAGFIRSRGMERFRKRLFGDLNDASIVLLNNKARFFSIDTRFKFLLLSGMLPSANCKNKGVCYSQANVVNDEIRCGEPVRYSLKELQLVRRDLSVPECGTVAEKDLFCRICANGVPMSEFLGDVKIMRELDMTLDRDKFTLSKGENLPLVEGRMVQPFRFGAKAYLAGQGRKAKWIPSCGLVVPQFFVPKDMLADKIQKRVSCLRAGFCDIAGQTNERAMMSVVIPKGVVCGNKVPTLLFNGNDGERRLLLWVGVVNSFVFDWMLRRVLTTTVNMFLLNGLSFPDLPLDGKLARSIVKCTRELTALGKEYYLDNDRMSRLRVKIDTEVMKAYRIDEKDMKLIMTDFPLLDRKQPPIKGEQKSTITRDLLFSYVCSGLARQRMIKRVEAARLSGAKAYIPYEMRSLTKGGD